jgi:hypothetical protein
MTDELEGQTPEAGTVKETPVEGASPQGAVYDGPIEKFKGKTAQEIAQSYGELESTFGKTQAELTDARGKVTAYEQWYNQNFQQPQQPQQAQMQSQQYGQQQVAPDIYEDPAKAVQHYATPAIRQELHKMDVQHAFEESERAFNDAKRTYPAAFEGVNEQELKDTMRNGVIANLRSGGEGVGYKALRDPYAWATAAHLSKGIATNFATPGPGPMNVPQTEQPAGARPDGEPSRMSRSALEAKRLVTEAGTLSDKQAQEVWEETLKDIEGGRDE